MQKSAETQDNLKARAAAQAAADGLAITPTGIVQYTSRGRVLVIGDEDAQLYAARMESPLQAQALLVSGEEEPGVPVIPAGGRTIGITGYLGAFQIELGEPGKANHDRIDVDLVVDLCETPLISSPLPPPGYWHVSKDPADQDRVLEQLAGMVGTFEKPRFFAYDADICAHARAGRPGCNRCIEACPAEAIISIGERVEVNPNLCQGGGICSVVCPTGAMRYAYPGPADTEQRLKTMLQQYLSAGGVNPVVVFISEEDAANLQQLPANALLLVQEELGSVGLEIWLSALAWGATRVLLVDGGSVPSVVEKALMQQLTVASELLEGMGFSASAIGYISANELEMKSDSDMPGITPAGYGAMKEKRTTLYFALDHLFGESASQQDVLPLSQGAPFGRVLVDQQRCTLCMGCTSVCPAKALQAGDDTPKLVFHESNCVQCGLCEVSCPEKAISLEARFITDPEIRRKARTLHEDEPFLCVSCGKPFATHKIIDNMLDRLSAHAMFQSERARRRLKMCEDCRVVDAVQDPEAMEAGIRTNKTINH